MKKAFLLYFPINKEHAFTLAEVLVTLGIIGVVAALTLPALITDYRDKELETRAKKAYSIINQAVQKGQVAHGVVGDNTALFDENKTSEEVALDFSKCFNKVKFCKNSKIAGCKNTNYRIKYNSLWSSGTGVSIDSDISGLPKIVLPDGMILAVQQRKFNEVTHQVQQDEYGNFKTDADGNLLYFDYVDPGAFIYFDTNGAKGPNQFGRDAFVLGVWEDKINIHGWSKTGGNSLKSILMGNGIIYTDYNVGEEFQF